MALKLLNEYLNYADRILNVTLASVVGHERLKVRNGRSESFNLERSGHDFGGGVSPAGFSANVGCLSVFPA